MADLNELFGPEAWKHIQDQLERGEHPELTEIARVLRGRQPVPHDVRCYIAGLLEGKIERKRGRKVDKSELKRLRNWALRSELNLWIEVCKRAERRGIKMAGGAYLVAREKVSRESGIPEDTIDKIYFPRQKGKKAVS